MREAGIKVEEPEKIVVRGVGGEEGEGVVQGLRVVNQGLEKKLEQMHGEVQRDRKRVNEAEI